jgi:hypothetical protein
MSDGFLLKKLNLCINYSDTSTKLVTRAACHRLLILLSKRKSAQRVHESTALLDSTRYAGVAGRNVEARVPCEEVAWPEKQCHRLCRHDGEIFRTGKVGDAESVPENNIGVD